METILRAPQWPAALSSFVTWCLMWDPKNRPTSAEAMKHEYFNAAIDPLRPKSSRSRLLGLRGIPVRLPFTPPGLHGLGNLSSVITHRPYRYRCLLLSPKSLHLIGRQYTMLRQSTMSPHLQNLHPLPDIVRLLISEPLGLTARILRILRPCQFIHLLGLYLPSRIL